MLTLFIASRPLCLSCSTAAVLPHARVQLFSPEDRVDLFRGRLWLSLHAHKWRPGPAHGSFEALSGDLFWGCLGEARLPSEPLTGLQRWGSDLFPRGPGSGQVGVRAAAQAPRPPPASAAARPAREGARRAAGSGAASGMSRYTRPPNTSLFVRNVADATRLVKMGPCGSTGRGAGVSGCRLGSGGLSGCRWPPGAPGAELQVVGVPSGCQGTGLALGCWPGVGSAGQVLGCRCGLSVCPGFGVRVRCWGAVVMSRCWSGVKGAGWVAPAVMAVLAQALESLLCRHRPLTFRRNWGCLLLRMRTLGLAISSALFRQCLWPNLIYKKISQFDLHGFL